MKKALINKIITNGIYDTAKYRYIAESTYTGLRIIRCDINMVGTTAMFNADNFTTVYEA